MQKKKTILILNNTGNYIFNFRSELINKLQSQGYNVIAAFPYDGGEIKLKKQHNIECIDFALSSYSKNIFNELKTLRNLITLIRKHEIDLVLPFTIKPVLYSSIAAYFHSSNIISTITGMGKIYTDPSLKFKMISKITNLAYFIGFKKNSAVIFQNPDDKNHFTSKKILPTSKARLVNGSGINLNNFKFHQRYSSDEISFVMVARILKEKGVREFCIAAANIIKKHNVKCTIVGGEVNGHSITIENKSLTDYCLQNKINYLGHRTDILDILNKHTIFVLPSYREGTPRSTLEALASGMPIITTNAPGTKETIDNELNGLLVDARSTSSLEAAMDQQCRKKDNIENMSKHSRILAEKKFNVDVVTNDYLKIINETLLS